MSTSKTKIVVRSARASVDDAVTPTVGIGGARSSPTSTTQKKVTEYFPTVHRDHSQKSCKRLKEFSEDVVQIGKGSFAFESPNKLARLKSPQTSPVEEKQGEIQKAWEPKAEFVVNKDEEINDAVESVDAEIPEKYIEKVDSTKQEEEATLKKGVEEFTDNKACSDVIVKIKKNLSKPTSEINKYLDNNSKDVSSAVKLVESIKNSESNLNDTLPLPVKYERLLRLFDYTEVVVSWMETQKKRITLNEVMLNVQRKLKSDYSEHQFAQILSVYPESYKIHYERRWMPIGGRHCSRKEFEYVIEPNLVDDLVLPLEESIGKEVVSSPLSSPVKPLCGSPTKASLVSLTRNPMTSPSKFFTKIGLKSPAKSPSRLKSPQKSPTKPLVTGCPPKLEARRLLRKLEFKSRLHKLVNAQHVAFLQNEGIDISPDEQLPRYHPDFDLDAVSDIIAAKLPEIPKGDANQPETMKEYMKTVPDSSETLPDKIKSVIKELRSPEKQVTVVANKPVPLSPKKYNEEKKNTSKPSLLERIRAKERERKRREMLRNPEMEQRKGRLERASHALLQCICSYYNLKKVGSMRFAELVDKLTFGIGNISQVEIEATVNLLCEVCPTYFKMVEVRGEKYVQLRENKFSAIRDIVNAEIAKCV